MATVLLGAGFAAKANACTRRLNSAVGVSENLSCTLLPPEPNHFNQILPNAAVSGTTNPSSQSVTSQITFRNYFRGKITSILNIRNQTIETWLPHAYSKVHVYEQNGTRYVRIYLFTQSQYVPNGDNGTFVFDSAGKLVSGSSYLLTRLRNEVQEADPQLMAQTKGLISWIEGNWDQIAGCGILAAGAAIVVLSPFAGAGAGVAAAGGSALFGGSIDGLFQRATKACF